MARMVMDEDHGAHGCYDSGDGEGAALKHMPYIVDGTPVYIHGARVSSGSGLTTLAQGILETKIARTSRAKVA
eukprot:8185498-Pyramimonas_sp.AAC.1